MSPAWRRLCSPSAATGPLCAEPRPDSPRVWLARMAWRSPSLRRDRTANRSSTSSKNSTTRTDWHGLKSSSSKSRAAWNSSCPFVWSSNTRSMCSIAAGLRSSRATVACIASATDAKKISPRPFFSGNGTIFSFAEMMAASVPSLPHSRWLRLSGSPHATVNGVSRPALEQAGREPLGNLQPMEVNEVGHEFALLAQGVVLRPDLDGSPVRQHDFQFADMVGRRAVEWRVRAAGVIGDHARQGSRANWWRRQARSTAHAGRRKLFNWSSTTPGPTRTVRPSTSRSVICRL